MSKSKNDIAWEKIFRRYKILARLSDSERVTISSSDINQFREARLMTKFDHRSQLPKSFVDNDLAILPISKGNYEIGHFETFHVFEEDNADEPQITVVDFPTFLESIDFKDITSESIAINCVFVTKILHDFVGEEVLFPTVSGRMSSSSFNFTIKSQHAPMLFHIENSQIEIDGGFEGEKSLSLIEAKNYISDDFIIRQLYYPFRLWSNKILKRVRPIFLTYSNGVFNLKEYEFTDPCCYNSLRLIQCRKYAFRERIIHTADIQKILDTVETLQEPTLPFPQADSFERVINLCELLKQAKFISKEDITQNYDFTHRQTDYYTNAAKYLGLIADARENRQAGYVLTPDGIRVFNLSIIERQLEFVRLILLHQVFHDTLKLYFDSGNIPTKDDVVEIMKRAKLRDIASEQTYKRRASTVVSWISWILKLVE